LSQDGEQFATDVKRSSRDLEELRRGLQRALSAQIPAGTDHSVESISGTSATGMSSETLLFDASWSEDGERRRERLVARVAPQGEDVPVFPSYDLPGQFMTIKTVATLTDVPVPAPWWCETDPSVIGSPFFVMGRVEGEVPTDIPPYNFGEGWVYTASPDQLGRLQDSTVAVLAELHAIPEPGRHFVHLLGDYPGDSALRRHFASRRSWYEWAARDSGRSPLLEKVFSWLEDRWPAHESDTVFCWGDSRIGNVMYRDFQPSAVLDWEMAGLAPGETDLAWMAYLHRMFEDMAVAYGFPHMPDFLRLEDLASTYERLTRKTPRDLDWYFVYAALQLGIVYLRTGMRSVRFGERDRPADADELLMNADGLRSLIGA
jgi:aminoglycoside phosphotransferase (APT) family kinase protein